MCKTGFIAAAALTQKAQESIQPFKGESGKLLAQVWDISTTCTCKGACTCQQLQVISLAQAFDAGLLPGIQHAMSEKLADRRHARFADQQVQDHGTPRRHQSGGTGTPC